MLDCVAGRAWGLLRRQTPSACVLSVCAFVECLRNVYGTPVVLQTTIRSG